MKDWLQYGLLAAVPGLAFYVMYLHRLFEKREKKWQDAIERQSEIYAKSIEKISDKFSEQLKIQGEDSRDMSRETHKVVREHSNILTAFKILIEQKFLK